MLDFNKAFGKPSEPSDKDKPKIVIHRSQAEAEAETGYFYISSMIVSAQVADAIRDFVNRKGLRTYTRENKRKTSNNYYTIKFTLKLYYIDPVRNNATKYGWIDHRGHEGNLKSSVKGTTIRMRDKYGEYESFYHGPSQEAVAKYEEIWEKTPDLKQLYFWICQKYPSHIKDMSYTKTKPSYLNDDDEDFAYGDEFD